MADAAIKFLLDEDYAKRIGDNARSNVLEMMDPEKLSRHERNEYDKLFARFYVEGNILKTEKFLSDK